MTAPSVFSCCFPCWLLAESGTGESLQLFGAPEVVPCHRCGSPTRGTTLLDPSKFVDPMAAKPTTGRAGLKDDSGKPRWDLLPLAPIEGIVDVLTFGARKYAPNGWRSVPDARERYFAALMRHLVAWRNGETCDEDSGLPHLDHVLCNAVFLRELDT